MTTVLSLSFKKWSTNNTLDVRPSSKNKRKTIKCLWKHYHVADLMNAFWYLLWCSFYFKNDCSGCHKPHNKQWTKPNHISTTNQIIVIYKLC